MKSLFVLFCLLISVYNYSQTISPESLFSATGNSSNSYAQISWTLGDCQVLTYSSDDIVLTQGFLQSDLVITNLVNIKDNNSIDLKVFPNPISDYLNIKYTSTKEISTTFYLYNLNGSLLHFSNTKTKQYSEIIDFRGFESGTYLLKAVSKDGSFIKTYKLFYDN